MALKFLAFPRDLINTLNVHVVAILGEAETRKRMVEIGIQPNSGTPEQLEAFVQSEAQKWRDLVRRARIEAQ